MGYIGTPVQQALTKATSQYFNGTGSQTVFTLNRAVNVPEDLEVFVNNIQQEPGVGKSYTATGTTLTFDAAPSSGTGNIYVIYRGSAEVTRRLEHDPNAALAATTGTFSGNVDVTGTVTADGLTVDGKTVVGSSSSNALEIHSNGDTEIAFSYSTKGNIYGKIIGDITQASPLGGEIAFQTATGGSLTERLRLDSSGNLLVGKTSVSTSTAGFEVRSDGLIYSGRDGNEPLILNRLTSDGNIVDLRKDGSTVGSIGVLGGIMDIDGGSSLGVGAGDTGLLFTASSDDIRPFNVTTGSSRDAAIDLGTSSRRFKDLYLSGGVYLGGTGSANYLDDYEFGFYTPSYGAGVSSGSQTYSQRTGVYTKIGNIVKVWVDMTLTANSGQSGQPYITLPFTSASAGQLGTDSAGHQRFEMGSWNSWATDNAFTGSDTSTGWITTSSSLMSMYRTGGTSNPISGWSTNATGRISGTIWYTTA